jgi:hypothetical protein
MTTSLLTRRHLLHLIKKTNRWRQAREARRYLLHMRKKNKEMTTNQGGLPSFVLCPFTNYINTQKIPTSITGVVPFSQEPIQMLYTSLPLSSLPLHLLGSADIPTYRKVHQAVMQLVRSQKIRRCIRWWCNQRDHKNPRNALGGDAVIEVLVRS